MSKIFLLILLFCCRQAAAQSDTAFQLQSGDLLFQDLDCGPMCDAIEAVTQGYEGHPFSHVGLVSREGDRLMVIEAMGPGVRMVPLDSFTHRSAHKLYVGRLKKQYRSLIPSAIAFSRRQLGKPYDDAFLYGNGKYYCSELIYDAFLYANDNKPVFRLEPMTFKQPGSDRYFPIWLDYYKKLGQSIPEGKLGCNPGGLSRSEKIEIVHIM